ncbi:MAG: hypothetical protein LVQ75_01830 [Candidatus Babeliales bacterium]|jgi:hypothetical protein
MIKKSLLVIILLFCQASHSSETKPTYFHVSRGNCFCRTRFKVPVNNQETAGKAKKPSKKQFFSKETTNSNPRKAAIAAIASMQGAAKDGEKLDALLSKQK